MLCEAAKPAGRSPLGVKATCPGQVSADEVVCMVLHLHTALLERHVGWGIYVEKATYRDIKAKLYKNNIRIIKLYKLTITETNRQTNSNYQRSPKKRKKEEKETTKSTMKEGKE